MTELAELLHHLQARRQRLMSMRRENNARLADFAVADVSLFWLLNALNSAEPVLKELLDMPYRHPELLYRSLPGWQAPCSHSRLSIMWMRFRHTVMKHLKMCFHPCFLC